MYRRSDIIFKHLTREYIELFDNFKSSLLVKDEINRLQPQATLLQKVDNLYSELEKITKDRLLYAAQLQLEYIMGDDYDEQLIDNAWLQELFENYNEVTKYIYENEIKRKSSYLFEGLMSTLYPADDITGNTNILDMSAKTQAVIDKALKLWSRMALQMSIDVADKATKTAYVSAGVQYVMWVTARDSRTCAHCSDMDGEIFPIADAPGKQHYNCRCYYIPVRE